MEKLKDLYDKLYSRVQRFGADAFRKWLDTTDFWAAPAMPSGPMAYEGALALRTLHVAQIFADVSKTLDAEQLLKDVYDDDSVVLLPLLTSLSRVNSFTPRGDGSYAIRHGLHEFDVGRCERAIAMASCFFRLRPEEVQVLRWYDVGPLKMSEHDNLVEYIRSHYENDAKLMQLAVKQKQDNIRLMQACKENNPLLTVMQGVWEMSEEPTARREVPQLGC